MRIITICFLTSLAINTFGQDAEKLFQKGNSLESEGKFEEALVYVDSSLRIDSSLYQRYEFRAEINIALGRISDAIADITKCIDRTKLHKAYYYRKRAELHIRSGDPNLAMADIKNCRSCRWDEVWMVYN